MQVSNNINKNVSYADGEFNQLITLRNRAENLERKIGKVQSDRNISSKEKAEETRVLQAKLTEIKNEIAFAEVGVANSFENSSLGQAIINIGGAIITPFVAVGSSIIGFMQKHPTMTTGLVLAGCATYVAATPIREGQVMNSVREGMKERAHSGHTFQSTEAWCDTHTDKKPICVSKMVDIAKTAASPEDRQKAQDFVHSQVVTSLKERAQVVATELSDINNSLHTLNSTGTLPVAVPSSLDRGHQTLSFDTVKNEFCAINHPEPVRCARYMISLKGEDRTKASEYLRSHNLEQTMQKAQHRKAAWDKALSNLESIDFTLDTTATSNPIQFSTGAGEEHQKIMELFGRHDYHDAATAVKNGKIDVCDVIEYALLTDFPYTHNPNVLPYGWTVNMQLANKAIAALGSAFSINKQGVIITPDGLTCAVLQKGNEVVVSMGGTGSGDSGGNIVLMSISNPLTLLNQWRHNLQQAMFGNYVPVHYEQAANITTVIKSLTDAEVSTAGHSLGGGMSSYAAGMAGTPTQPMKSHSYCSSQLGKKMNERIAEKCKTLEDAERLISRITHYTVKGDPVDNMHGTAGLISDISVLGTAYEIDPESDTTTWFDWGKSLLTENGVMLHANYRYYWERLADKLGKRPCPHERKPTFAPTPASERSWLNRWSGGWIG